MIDIYYTSVFRHVTGPVPGEWDQVLKIRRRRVRIPLQPHPINLPNATNIAQHIVLP